MREDWTEIYATKPILQNSLLEYTWRFTIIEAQQWHKELPLTECLLKQTHQEELVGWWKR